MKINNSLLLLILFAIINNFQSKVGANILFDGKYSSISRFSCSGLNCSNMTPTAFGIVVGVSIGISILFVSAIFILKCYLKSKSKPIVEI